MKKLVLSLVIIGFVAFGAMGVQNLIASSSPTEIVNLDKDPKKADDKKAADTKEVKADAKTTESGEKSCGSSKSCCGSEKSCSSTSTPDKK